MTVKEALLEATKIAEETGVGMVGNTKDHRVIVMIAELLLSFEAE